jgi:hydroxypyruvate isomerase
MKIADVPARHEPGTGEINWDYIFKTIDKVSADCAWDGWIG